MVLTCTKSFAAKHDLAYKTLLFEVAPSQFFLAWHTTNDKDPGCMWLRELIKDSFVKPSPDGIKRVILKLPNKVKILRQNEYT